jgi:thiol:disulfide interchange protein
MRFALSLGLLLAALAVAPALFAEDGDKAEPRKGVQWTEDYAEALKTAKAENKRIFIEFTATW